MPLHKVLLILLFYISALPAQQEGRTTYRDPEAQRQVEQPQTQIKMLEAYMQELREAHLRERVSRLEDHEVTARWLAVVIVGGLWTTLLFILRTLLGIRRTIRNGREGY